MTRIGIIGAMDEEVSRLKAQMSNVEEKEIAGMLFCAGKLIDREAVVVESGIGKVNMAICAQILIDQYEVSTLINTGVAGSLRNEINIGDLVVSTDAWQHDVDVTGCGNVLGEIPRMKTSIFKADERLVKLAEKMCKEVNPDISVFRGRVLSGDQFISDHAKKEQLIRDFDGFCAEMEGAAMAQVAYLNQIPFVIIRAISDKADHSAEMSYAEFEHQAIEHTVKLINAMISFI